MATTPDSDKDKILQVIETALVNHNNWYDDLVRRLLCHLELPASLVAKDAHRKCAFGAWFYGMGESPVENSPIFKTIGALHQEMHDNARKISLSFRSSGYIQDIDFDIFYRSLQQFREALTDFRDRAAKTVNNSAL
jgi:hypothetical protein